MQTRRHRKRSNSNYLSDTTNMIRTRKAAANKRNASPSTGPRTLGGKLRSSLNSYRHGLATAISNNPSAALNIDRLATDLTTYSNGCRCFEEARAIAEGYFDLARIRAARAEVLWRIGGLENCVDDDLNRAVNASEKIARYEQRTRSRLRRDLKAMSDRDPKGDGRRAPRAVSAERTHHHSEGSRQI